MHVASSPSWPSNGWPVPTLLPHPPQRFPRTFSLLPASSPPPLCDSADDLASPQRKTFPGTSLLSTQKSSPPTFHPSGLLTSPLQFIHLCLPPPHRPGLSFSAISASPSFI